MTDECKTSTIYSLYDSLNKEAAGKDSIAFRQPDILSNFYDPASRSFNSSNS